MALTEAPDNLRDAVDSSLKIKKILEGITTGIGYLARCQVFDGCQCLVCVSPVLVSISVLNEFWQTRQTLFSGPCLHV